MTMIAALEGVLEHRGTDSVVVKLGSVSLQVYVPGSTLNQLGSVGGSVYLHTHLHLREDNVALYGFSSVGELWLFQDLISVSGIGPKAALALLSALDPEQLSLAIVSGDVELLSHMPCIGKKMASRLVLELKSKLAKGWEGLDVLPQAAENADVVAALTSLGYSLRESSQAVSRLQNSQGLDLEAKVKLALQQLAGE